MPTWLTFVITYIAAFSLRIYVRNIGKIILLTSVKAYHRKDLRAFLCGYNKPLQDDKTPSGNSHGKDNKKCLLLIDSVIVTSTEYSYQFSFLQSFANSINFSLVSNLNEKLMFVLKSKPAKIITPTAKTIKKYLLVINSLIVTDTGYS